MRATLRKITKAFAGVCLGLGIVLIVQTARFDSQQLTVPPSRDPVIDTTAAARRLAGALRFRTVSRDHGPADSSAFTGLHRYLREAFPQVHSKLERSVISDLSLLYRWPGRDTTAKPVLLMAHLDVVPAPSEERWEHPPFSGAIASGYVWGRGALDDKVGVTGVLEAVRTLTAKDFRPERTIYIAFGHDEEVGGRRGARQIARHLTERGVELASVLDEGGAIVRDAVPGVEAPVALVGIAEKGYLSVALSVEGQGGHSALPPRATSIQILSEALTRLAAAPLPARLDGAARQFLRFVGPEAVLPVRGVLANRWLFGPAVRYYLGSREKARTLVRTTTAATIIRGGTKDNVLPGEARAVVNFRILPGTSSEDVLAHVRRAVDDPRVTIRAVGERSEPSPASSVDGPAFQALRAALRRAYAGGDLVVAPYLVIGATDSRHYVDMADQVYRFAPFVLESQDRSRIHGSNERIALDDYARVVRFYYHFMDVHAGSAQRTSAN